MKHDATWSAVSLSFDPLKLFKLIEKTTLAQSDDAYPCATVYNHIQSVYGLQQGSSTNADYHYDIFNTKKDVGESLGVTHEHEVLLEFETNFLHEERKCTFADLQEEEQLLVRKAAEERYMTNVMFIQSGKQNSKVKEDLKNAYALGDDKFPKTQQGFYTS